jgi:hypothetical protein
MENALSCYSQNPQSSDMEDGSLKVSPSGTRLLWNQNGQMHVFDILISFHFSSCFVIVFLFDSNHKFQVLI